MTKEEYEKLRKEMESVSGTVHELLGDIDVQIAGASPTQRITLEIPRAWVYLATYLAVAEERKGGGRFWQDVESGEVKLTDKACRVHWRFYLERQIHHLLSEDLHWLANAMHPTVIGEALDGTAAPRNPEGEIADSFDDDIPF